MKVISLFRVAIVLGVAGLIGLKTFVGKTGAQGPCLWVCTGFEAVKYILPVVGEPPEYLCYGFRNPISDEDGSPPAEGFVYSNSGWDQRVDTQDLITRISAELCGTPTCGPWALRVKVIAYHLPQDDPMATTKRNGRCTGNHIDNGVGGGGGGGETDIEIP